MCPFELHNPPLGIIMVYSRAQITHRLHCSGGSIEGVQPWCSQPCGVHEGTGALEAMHMSYVPELGRGVIRADVSMQVSEL